MPFEVNVPCQSLIPILTRIRDCRRFLPPNRAFLIYMCVTLLLLGIYDTLVSQHCDAAGLLTEPSRPLCLLCVALRSCTQAYLPQSSSDYNRMSIR